MVTIAQFNAAVNAAKSTIANTDSLEDGKREAAGQFSVFLGHDGHPDPDDNLGMIGAAAIVADKAKNAPNYQFNGFIYGDTTTKRKNAMKGSGSTGNTAQDLKGKANYAFFKQFAKAALKKMSLPAGKIYDVVPQKWNFSGNPTVATKGGLALATDIAKSISNGSRITVYAAGGGHNAAREAVQLLKQKGIKDPAILDNFVVVQHSGWNYKNTNDPGTTGATNKFTLFLTDQNKQLGTQGNAAAFGLANNETFAGPVGKAWKAAIGKPKPAIPGFQGKKDASDAGIAFYVTGAFNSDFTAKFQNREPVTYSDINSGNDQSISEQKNDGRIAYLTGNGSGPAAQIKKIAKKFV